ncbi:hypothetical protein Tco_0205044 [Tanacetum coccineum]
MFPYFSFLSTSINSIIIDNINIIIPIIHRTFSLFVFSNILLSPSSLFSPHFTDFVNARRIITNAPCDLGVPLVVICAAKKALAEPSPSWLNIDEKNLDLGERNVKQCKRKICDGYYTTTVRVFSSSGVAPYNDATLGDLKAKHPFKPAPLLPYIPIDHHHLIASSAVVLYMIKSFPYGTSCGRDGLHAKHLLNCLSGVVVAIFDELATSITQVVNLFLDGKFPKMLGTIWRHLVSKVSATMISYSLDDYLNDLPFGVSVSGGGEARLHAVNRLIKNRGYGASEVGSGFKNAVNVVSVEVMLQEVRLYCPAISRWGEFCYSNPARLYYGEHSLWSHQGVQQGDPLLFALVLHHLICKIKDALDLDERALGWHLEEIHVTWAHLEKKQTRLQPYTIYLEELGI